MAARLQWDFEYTTRLWQGCGKVVTSLWIDNVAARLQWDVNILQGCDKLVE